MRGLLAQGAQRLLHYGPDGQRRGEGMRVFAPPTRRAPRMLVFGAIDFAAAVARVGRFLGYRVTVCDARPVFATPPASPRPTRWSWSGRTATCAGGRGGDVDARSVICVLTHDPKFDVPLLEVALRLPDVGLRRCHGIPEHPRGPAGSARERGLTEAELARLASPIGLDLGARTPEETAVSIAAEIIALRWGGGGRRLSGTAGAIHHGSDLARQHPAD